MAKVLILGCGTQGLVMARALNKAGNEVYLLYGDKNNYADASRYIKKKGRDSEEPTGNALIKADGMLYLQRRCTQVDATILETQKNEDGNYMAMLDLNDNNELYDLLSEGKMHFTPELIATGAKVIDTNEDYLATDKSGVFGEVKYIPDVKMLGFVWTNNPRPIQLV